MCEEVIWYDQTVQKLNFMHALARVGGEKLHAHLHHIVAQSIGELLLNSPRHLRDHPVEHLSMILDHLEFLFVDEVVLRLERGRRQCTRQAQAGYLPWNGQEVTAQYLLQSPDGVGG